MKKNKKVTGIKEEFFQKQKAKIKEFIVKKKDYINFFKEKQDIYSRQTVKNAEAEIINLNKTIEKINYRKYNLHKT